MWIVMARNGGVLPREKVEGRQLEGKRRKKKLGGRRRRLSAMEEWESQNGQNRNDGRGNERKSAHGRKIKVIYHRE